MRTIVVVACISLMGLASDAPAQVAGQQNYFQGLQALQEQRWTDAATAFSAAIDADDENASYHLGCGIACMMARDLQPAKREFDRALKLNPSDVETQRWAAGYYRLIGDQRKAASIRTPADYSRTVQEAAGKVHQIDDRHQLSPQEVAQRHKNLHNFAVEFAKSRLGNSPQLAAASLDHARKLIADKQIDSALAALDTILASNPDDDDALYLRGVCLVESGSFETARDVLTRVLTRKTAHGAAYAARAVALARLGALDRAKSDFAIASKLDQDAASAARGNFDAALSAAGKSESESSTQLYDALVSAAASQDDVDQLLEPALRVVQAQNRTRKRWDEAYQDELRKLEDELRASPRDPRHLMALAIFLYRGTDIPGEQLSPAGEYRAFRYSTPRTRQQEISRADQLFDEVLSLNRRNAAAIAWKAAIRIDAGEWPQGKALVEQAMQVDPELPLVLELLSRVLDHTAMMKSYQASNLRTPRSWTEFGVSYNIHWTRHPSQVELAQANYLESQAHALWAQAAASLEAAITKLSGTADGHYYAGLLAKRRNDHESALNSFRNAVELEPGSGRNQRAMIASLFALDRVDEASAAKDVWVRSHHTTATMQLTTAWGHMDRTAWKSALAAVDAAQQVDPADPRIPAYRAAIASAKGDSAGAARWLVVALALENARAKLAGADLSPGASGAVLADAASLTMLLNLHLAWRYSESNQPDKQLAVLMRSVALEARIAEDQRELKSSRAVLPTPSDKRSTRLRTVSNLIAWSKVMAAYALVSAGKHKDALAQFKQVTDWYKRDTYADAQGLAFSGMTRLEFAANDPDRGRRREWLSSAVIINRLSDEERQLAMDLIMERGRDSGMRIDQIQRQQQDLRYWYGARPAQPGGYDPTANPNYHGNDDAPPGMPGE